jgi:hypothetical protein
MLIAQAIATHNAVMECHRRAMIPEQPFEGWREGLDRALGRGRRENYRALARVPAKAAGPAGGRPWNSSNLDKVFSPSVPSIAPAAAHSASARTDRALGSISHNNAVSYPRRENASSKPPMPANNPATIMAQLLTRS